MEHPRRYRGPWHRSTTTGRWPFRRTEFTHYAPGDYVVDDDGQFYVCQVSHHTDERPRNHRGEIRRPQHDPTSWAIVLLALPYDPPAWVRRRSIAF